MFIQLILDCSWWIGTRIFWFHVSYDPCSLFWHLLLRHSHTQREWNSCNSGFLCNSWIWESYESQWMHPLNSNVSFLESNICCQYCLFFNVFDRYFFFLFVPIHVYFPSQFYRFFTEFGHTHSLNVPHAATEAADSGSQVCAQGHLGAGRLWAARCNHFFRQKWWPKKLHL